MNTKLVSGKLERISSDLLVILAFDAADKKPSAKPAIKVLAAGSAVAKAAGTILTGGEFAAGRKRAAHGGDALDVTDFGILKWPTSAVCFGPPWAKRTSSLDLSDELGSGGGVGLESQGGVF